MAKGEPKKQKLDLTEISPAEAAGQSQEADEEEAERAECVALLADATIEFICPKCKTVSAILDTMTQCKCPKCEATFRL